MHDDDSIRSAAERSKRVELITDAGVATTFLPERIIDWLDEIDRLRAELSGDWGEAQSLVDLMGDDAPRIRRLRDAHLELHNALHALVVSYPVAARLDRQVRAVVEAQRRINAIHEEAS